MIDGYLSHCEEPEYFFFTDVEVCDEPTAEEQALADAVDGTPDWTRLGGDPDYRVYFIKHLLAMSQPGISAMAGLGIDLPPINWQLASGSQAYRTSLVQRLLTQSDPVRISLKMRGEF